MLMNRTLTIVAIVLMMLGVSALGYSRYRDSAPATLHFQLTDQNGKAVTEMSYPNKYLIIFFGYTACPDICPTTLDTLAKSLDDLESSSRREYQVLFITLDPLHDNTDTLKRYMENFSHDMTGLTGSESQIAKLAAQCDLYYRKVQDGKNASTYSIEHDAVLFIIDPHGKIIKRLLPTLSAHIMAENLKSILTHPSN